MSEDNNTSESPEGTVSRGARRRNVLKTAGASLVGLSAFPALSSATRKKPPEVIQKGLRIRDKTNSTDRFVEYLRNHGFTVGRSTTTASYPLSASDDGMSTQKLDEVDLTMDLIIYYDCSTCDYDCVVDLSWDWSQQGVDDWGEPPRDITGFYWENADWEIATSDYYTSDLVYFDGFDDTHTHFEFNDSKGDDGSQYYCASLLTPTGDTTESNREVGGQYTHTYDGVTIKSVYGSYPAGIQVELSNEDKEWDHHDTVDQSMA